MSEDQINEMAADVITRGERIDPLMPPPPEVKVLEHFGEDKKVLTPTEAANELTSWRERHTAAQQEELAELAGEAEQARQAEAQQAQQPQPSSHNSSNRSNPILCKQSARRSLPSANGLRTSSESKVMRLPCATTMINWLRQSCRSFPRFETGHPIPPMSSNFAPSDPQRFQKLAMADQMLARATAEDRGHSTPAGRA